MALFHLKVVAPFFYYSRGRIAIFLFIPKRFGRSLVAGAAFCGNKAGSRRGICLLGRNANSGNIDFGVLCGAHLYGLWLCAITKNHDYEAQAASGAIAASACRSTIARAGNPGSYHGSLSRAWSVAAEGRFEFYFWLGSKRSCRINN